MNNLAQLLYERGEYAEAEPFFRDSLTMLREHFDDDRPASPNPQEAAVNGWVVHRRRAASDPGWVCLPTPEPRPPIAQFACERRSVELLHVS